MKNSVLKHFKFRFENPQIYVKSPGRANIIGEHTDYNHGLVLPFAIKQCIHMYIGQNLTNKIRVFASNLNEYEEIDLAQLSFRTDGWSRYFVNSLVACNYDKNVGIDIAFGGDLPQGGGVSSSSAITCGFLGGLNTLFDLGYDIDQLIDLSSQAENGIGLNGGIMDQTSIFKGKKNHALKIDFLDFSVEEVKMPDENFTFYLFNSGQKHNLVETEYNKRRATCEKALNIFKNIKPKIKTLRDITRQDIEEILRDAKIKKRCIHVLEENNRVISGTKVLEDKMYEKLGPLLIESHWSLSKNYEVSTDEIDYLVLRSQKISNILGSRIMGGGFGGCTINLVKGRLSDNQIEKLVLDYKNKTGYSLSIDKICASNGVEIDYL